jgi:hypothetical protein
LDNPTRAEINRLDLSEQKARKSAPPSVLSHNKTPLFLVLREIFLVNPCAKTNQFGVHLNIEVSRQIKGKNFASAKNLNRLKVKAWASSIKN